MEALALLLVATVPHTDAVEVRCQTVEINTVMNMASDPPVVGIRQLIFREPDRINDWRMIDGTPGLPHYDHQRGLWITRWYEGRRLIEVRAVECWETFSEMDRELIEREWLPHDQRRRIVP